MISLWKRVYGESPLHLLGQLVAFAIAAYAVYYVVEVTSTDNLSLVIWFVGGAILHDALFVPIYLTLDLITRLGVQDNAMRRVRVVNHIRFPAVVSFLMFAMFFPLILRKGEANLERNAGIEAPDYLPRWLLVTALLFAVSAVAYAVRLRLDAQRQRVTPAAASPTST